MLIELDNLIPAPLPELIVESSSIRGKKIRFESKSRILISAGSGKGKSTLLHMLYGLRCDYSGEVRVNDKSAREFSSKEWQIYRRERVALQFQELRLFPNLSALENLLLLPSVNPSVQSPEEMSERLGMASFLNRKITTLSFGQRQRIALIRVLRKPFELLMLDEPFSHLDQANQVLACSLIEEVVRINQASLLVSSLGPIPPLSFNQSISL